MVFGVLAHTEVGDNEEVVDGVLDASGRALDDTVLRPSARPLFVLLLGDAEQYDSGDAEVA